jgi:[histone H3]-lysine36 N-trimethyltransferase
MSKYKHKIPKDDLKRFAKEISKKLVASDYKAGRVKNPMKIDEKQAKKVKDFCKHFFEKAYQKHKKHENEKALRKKDEASNISPAASPPAVEDEDVQMSDDDDDKPTPPSVETPTETNGTLKRKRDSPEKNGDEDDADREATGSPSKRLNMEIDTPPPPPPPPAPPIETPPASTPREDLEMDQTNIHADTNFKGKSMADVLKEAQTEDDDGDDMEVEHGNRLAAIGEENNPMVDGQP